MVYKLVSRADDSGEPVAVAKTSVDRINVGRPQIRGPAPGRPRHCHP